MFCKWIPMGHWAGGLDPQHSSISHCLSASLGWFWASSPPRAWCSGPAQLPPTTFALLQTFSDTHGLKEFSYMHPFWKRNWRIYSSKARVKQDRGKYWVLETRTQHGNEKGGFNKVQLFLRLENNQSKPHQEDRGLWEGCTKGKKGNC